MKTRVRFDVWRFVFNAGWYRGEAFKLFNLTLLDFELPDDIMLFGFQVAKFMICLYLDK